MILMYCRQNQIGKGRILLGFIATGFGFTILALSYQLLRTAFSKWGPEGRPHFEQSLV